MMKKNDIPGASVVIANKQDILWAKGFGQLSKNNQNPVTSTTLFDIGSVYLIKIYQFS